MYDIFASEYAYDINTFLSLSAREIDLLLEKIGDRTYTRYERDAQLHGFKIASRPPSRFDDDSFSDEQMSKAEDAIKAAQERKRKEMAAKKRG